MKASTIVAVVFLLWISAGHLLRLVFKTQVTVGTLQIPMWISTAAFLFCAALAVWLWAQNRKREL
jgi:membrane protein implicated in regulation of membrane protease activity